MVMRTEFDIKLNVVEKNVINVWRERARELSSLSTLQLYYVVG